MIQDDSRIREFHAAYVKATGLDVPYGMDSYSDWFLFCERFSVGDIAVVVDYLRNLYRNKPDILKACLRLSKLIRERDRFAEYLAEARAEQRKPKRSNRDAVLRAAGREVDALVARPARSLAEIVGTDLEFIKEHLKWKHQTRKQE